MLKDLTDPFNVFRGTIFVFLTIYTALVFAIAAWKIAALLRGADPGRRFLRTYLSYQLVSIRVRPLAGELLQILFWTAALVLIWWLHWQIG